MLTHTPDHTPAPTSVDTTAHTMAYLVSRYPAVSHTFILNEVLRLRQQGFRIDMASINEPDRPLALMSEEERHESAQTYYVKHHGVLGAIQAHLIGLCRPLGYAKTLLHALNLAGWDLQRLLFALFYFTEALMLSRWLRRRGHTHLHVHFATAAANVAILVKKLDAIYLTLTVHGPDEFYDAPGQLLRQKIAAADHIICIGHFARSQLMHLSDSRFWHKFVVCPLGVDIELFQPGKVRTPHPFTILTVGRLVPAKGQHVLIHACHLLVAAGRDLRLVLVGSGPEELSLKRAVEQYGLEQHVCFTGAQDQQQVRHWYHQADAFALASFAEGIPLVLMEAMASGLPCISSRITGIPELIRDGIDGLLVSPANADELAAALNLLMEDADLRHQLAESGRARVADQYELQRNTQRLGALFTTLSGVAS